MLLASAEPPFRSHFHSPGGATGTGIRNDAALTTEKTLKNSAGRSLQLAGSGYIDAGKLEFHGTLAGLSTSDTFKSLMKSCRKTEWVVYSKPPFGGPAQVLEYLGRYTHRVAISNDRLLKLEDGSVTFRFKDYKAGNVQKTMTLTAEEFIRRFLLHVLPSRFVRIRHYGFLANRGRAAKLTLCRSLLACAGSNPAPVAVEPVHDWKTRYEMLTGRSIDVCPACREGRMVQVEIIEPAQRTRRPQRMDSS